MSDGWNMDDIVRSTRETTGQEPSVLAYRTVPIFEIEFAALEMEGDLDLTAWDEAVLAIAAARKAVTPHDADAYLGLEEGLAQAIVESLVREKLVMPAPTPRRIAQKLPARTSPPALAAASYEAREPVPDRPKQERSAGTRVCVP